MKVLMITGDKTFGPGNPRFDLQASVVEKLHVLYWGRGAFWPKLPKEHFDVVTAQDPFWRGHLAWHITWFTRSRLNIQVHTDLDAHPWLKRIFARIHLKRADSVRVVSEKIKKQVEGMGVRVPIYVLPVYVDIERFRKVERQPHSQKTILWIGRFEDEKDPLLAIEIFKTVLKDVPDAQLTMLGQGSLSQDVSSAAANLPIEVPGWQNPAPYFETADVVLCTSKHESWGASMVEALAAGVPVVAPDVGVAREAGATVVLRDRLAEAVIEALHSEVPGRLLLPVLSKEAWATQWTQTL